MVRSCSVAVTVTNNHATLSTTTLPRRFQFDHRRYTGDINYATSTSPVTTVAISQISTTTTVSYSPTLPVIGQQVTLTATITPGSTFSPLADRIRRLFQRLNAAGKRKCLGQYRDSHDYHAWPSATFPSPHSIWATATTLAARPPLIRRPSFWRRQRRRSLPCRIRAQLHLNR